PAARPARTRTAQGRARGRASGLVRSFASLAGDVGVASARGAGDLAHELLRVVGAEGDAVDRDRATLLPVEARDLLGDGRLEDAVGHEVDRVGARLEREREAER